MAESPPSSTSRLLTIPAGVENVLLSFISSGDGATQNILNLRQVCRTTQSWVDNLPKRQADVVFATTQVAMDCDEYTVRRFLTTPPPFGVTALSLQTDALHEPRKKLVEEDEGSLKEERTSIEKEEATSEDAGSLEQEEASLEEKQASLEEKEESLEEKEASLEEKEASLEEKEASLEEKEASLEEANESSEDEDSLEEEDPWIEEATWRSFFAFWKFQLETLKIDTRRYGQLPFNRLIVELMESPNLVRLQLCRGLDLLGDESLTPLFFGKVRELRAEHIDPGESFRNQFFAQLENNSNLRVLSVSLGGKEDFLGFTKVIDSKKNDMRLQMTFDLESTTLIIFAIDLEIGEEYQLYRDVLGKFAASIVASRSKIRLKISFMEDFDKLMTELLPRAVCRQLFTKIVSINNWTPEDESLSLMESLPQLKKLGSVHTEDSSVDFDRLTFPASLEELGFTLGFPARQRLPPSLTWLSLDNYECDGDSLVSSLIFLSGRCPELTSLEIRWEHAEQKSPPLGNFETASNGFSKLRKLSIFVEIAMGINVEEIRTALVNGFDWRSVELNYLQLSCADPGRRRIPAVAEEILRNLCEGSSAKTLLTIEVANESVTPEGLPWLLKLKSLASANWTEREEREEREGRKGEWHKLYAPVPRRCHCH